MDELNKYRIVNRYRIIIVFVFLSGLFISWFLKSGMYEYTIGFDKNASDIVGRAEEVQNSLINQVLNLFNYVTSAGDFISFVLPVLASALVILFIKEKSGLFFFKYVRNVSYRKNIISNILIQSSYSGITFFMAYFCFFIVGIILCKTAPEVNVEAFDLAFGQGFSIGELAWIGYLIEGVIKCFIFPFIYTFFACSLSLICKKTYQCIIIPTIYYFFLTIIISIGLGHVDWSPAYPIVSLTVAGTIIQSVIPLVFPLILSIGLILYSYAEGNKL
ncbi:hypothetical protein [Anaerosacchariphilus polymeriproducens]|nr:hypothetical protein [Anaerosacchariphilus polymeriproducens]